MVHKNDPQRKFDERHRCTRQFLSEVTTGKCTGVVTTLVIHEVVTACRRLLAQRSKSPTTPEETARLEELTREVLNQFGIEIRDADVLAQVDSAKNPVFMRAHRISIDSGIHEGQASNWHQIVGMDAIHASLAERADVDYFATHDKSMKHLVSDVKPAYLEDEYQ